MSPTTSKRLQTHEAIFCQFRQQLLLLAYRMLGTQHEAEDVLQEVFIQWQAISIDQVETPIALLKTLTIRRATDFLRKAYREREDYIGPWLPGPLNTNDNAWFSHTSNPETQQEIAQSLSLGFLLLLEQLTPTERAVFLLRTSFDYSHQEIAHTLSLNIDHCRQLFNRAKQRLNLKNRQINTDPNLHQNFLAHFQKAIETGDIDHFAQFLAEDVVLYSDGGGKAISALRPIFGNNKVARLLQGLSKKWRQHRNIQFTQCHINDTPALLWSDGKSLQTVVTIEVDINLTHRIYLMRNPDKIAHLQQQSSF